MPTPRNTPADRSLTERLAAWAAALRTLVRTGLSARAEAVMPARIPPRDRRCG